ncbi:hypothetical protein BDZ89DRAFT_1143096 [Hymenopellis radicata]|nr:hypothetical protein BDZ89DRAFT_1143096 [Hymenopellis radicata]
MALDRSQVKIQGIRQAFASILQLCLDPRPKVRKRAADLVKDVLATPPSPLQHYPYADRVAEWVNNALVENSFRNVYRQGTMRLKIPSRYTRSSTPSTSDNMSLRPPFMLETAIKKVKRRTSGIPELLPKSRSPIRPTLFGVIGTRSIEAGLGGQVGQGTSLHFFYEWNEEPDASDQWYRTYGLEVYIGLDLRRIWSNEEANDDVRITDEERWFKPGVAIEKMIERGDVVEECTPKCEPVSGPLRRALQISTVKWTADLYGQVDAAR